MLRAARSTFLRHAALFAGMNAVATAWTPEYENSLAACAGGYMAFGATACLAKWNPSGRAAAAASRVFGLLRGFRPQLPTPAHVAVVGAAFASVQIVSIYALDLPGLSARLKQERQDWHQQEAQQGEQVQQDAARHSRPWRKPLQPVLPLLTRRSMMRVRPSDTDWWFNTSLRHMGPGAAYYPPDHPLTAQAEAVRDQVLADALEDIEDSEGPGSATAARFCQLFGGPGRLTVRVYSCPGTATASFAVPHGIAVRDGPDMAAAVQHGVRSALREAGGMYSGLDSDLGARNGWYLRMLGLATLWPWTMTSAWQFSATALINSGFSLYDPELQLVQRRLREAPLWKQWDERCQRLEQEGRKEEVEELRRRRKERWEREQKNKYGW